MNLIEIREHNKKYLGLTENQYIIHEFISKLSMNEFPSSLLKYIQQQSKIYGFCGDACFVWIADWIKTKGE